MTRKKIFAPTLAAVAEWEMTANIAARTAKH
jgi:hypothetical protein